MGAVQREGEEILDPYSLWYMDIQFLLLKEGFKSNTGPEVAGEPDEKMLQELSTP